MSIELACCRVLPVSAISALTNSAKRCSMCSATLRSSAQRRARGLYGAIDERLIRLGDRGQDPAVDRIDVLKAASLAHELATDEAGQLLGSKRVRVGVGGQPHRVRILGKASA